MNFESGKWNESLTGKISLENIRKLYQPESHYRISWNEYRAGSELDGWNRKRKLYIISGNCKVTANEHSMSVWGGEFLDLPEGNYHLSVSTDSNIELLNTITQNMKIDFIADFTEIVSKRVIYETK